MAKERNPANQGGKKKPNKPKTPKRVPKGTPNISEAPGGYRRFFRFSQLAHGTAGSGRKIEDIWSTFLQELDDMQIPPEARSRIESLGAKKIFGKEGLGKGVTASLKGMGKENFRIVKEIRAAAMAAVGGVSDESLGKQWKALLKSLADDPAFDKGLLDQLRKVDPRVVARVGSNQTLSVLASRGDDPFVVKMFNKAFKRPGAPKLPAGVTEALEQANAGSLPKVSGVAGKELAKAGIKGPGLGKKLLGLTGKSGIGLAGVGLFAGLEANRLAGILGRESRAKKLALTGFPGLGPASSVDYLRNIVGQQEAVARRKVTMQQFEPELFQEVVRTLSDTGASQNTLTSTERRIGSDAKLGVDRRGRSADDVQFLLDQLFSQMGQ